MSHGISDVTAALFAQMQRLAREDMSAEQIEAECKRAESMIGLGDTIIAGANTQLKAAKLFAEHGKPVLDHLPQIGKPTPKDADG